MSTTPSPTYTQDRQPLRSPIGSDAPSLQPATGASLGVGGIVSMAPVPQGVLPVEDPRPVQAVSRRVLALVVPDQLSVAPLPRGFRSGFASRSRSRSARAAPRILRQLPRFVRLVVARTLV